MNRRTTFRIGDPITDEHWAALAYATLPSAGEQPVAATSGFYILYDDERDPLSVVFLTSQALYVAVWDAQYRRDNENFIFRVPVDEIRSVSFDAEEFVLRVDAENSDEYEEVELALHEDAASSHLAQTLMQRHSDSGHGAKSRSASPEPPASGLFADVLAGGATGTVGAGRPELAAPSTVIAPVLDTPAASASGPALTGTGICPYCFSSVGAADALACPGCGTEHHQDCWQESGQCAVTGCTSSSMASVPVAPAVAAPPPPVTAAVRSAPVRFCPACGSALNAAWKFCGGCGGSIGTVPPPPSAASPQSPSPEPAAAWASNGPVAPGTLTASPWTSVAPPPAAMSPWPTVPPPPGAAMSTEWPLVAWLLVGGGLALIIGAFLPWATISTPFGSLSKSGIDGGDGWITVILGVALAATGIRTLAQRVRIPFVGALIGTVIAGLVTLYELVDVTDRISELSDVSEGLASADIGAGLWLSAAGVVAAAIGTFRSRTISDPNRP